MGLCWDTALCGVFVLCSVGSVVVSSARQVCACACACVCVEVGGKWHSWCPGVFDVYACAVGTDARAVSETGVHARIRVRGVPRCGVVGTPPQESPPWFLVTRWHLVSVFFFFFFFLFVVGGAFLYTCMCMHFDRHEKVIAVKVGRTRASIWRSLLL